MRNPLTALLLRMGNIADDLPPRARAEYREAAHEGGRLMRVLEELLALARAERHLGSVRGYDVGQLVDDRLAAWRLRAEARGQILVREGVASATAVVDPESLGRALDEVLDNATKYAPERGVVRAALHTDPDAVRVTVTDDGQGLPAYQLSRVTDRFWRSGAHANVPGSGLGLSIVVTLLQTFGASLEVARAHPHGLAVTLVLPRSPEDRDGRRPSRRADGERPPTVRPPARDPQVTVVKA
jgi:signal transduction histidine kinase